MKTITLILLTISSLLYTSTTTAQVPDEFTQGSITLSNGKEVTGYIKDNMAKKGNIIFMENSMAKKITYDGIALNKCTINNNNYSCISGDFFKVYTQGKLALLQKVSKTSTQIIYSGNEPIGVAGTEGKNGDYYLLKSNILFLLTKKNVATALTTHLNDCSTPMVAYDKENFASLATLVNNYNNCK